MEFQIKKERLKHNLAGKIPDLIWQDFFAPRLSEAQLSFLSGELNQFKKIDYRETSVRDRQSFWLTFATIDNQIDFNQLIRLAEICHLSDSELFMAALYLQNPEFSWHLLGIFSSEEIEKMFTSQRYQIFYLAAKNGHIKLLEYFAEQYPSLILEAIQSGEPIPYLFSRKGYIPYGALRFAVENGHPNIVAFIFKNLDCQFYNESIEANAYEAPCLAAKKGDLALLNYLMEKYESAKYPLLFSSNHFEIFHITVKKGHVAILSYLFSLMTEEQIQELLLRHDFELFRLACKKGRTDIVQLCLQMVKAERLQKMLSSNQNEALIKALSRGHMDVVALLQQKILYENWHAIGPDNNYKMGFKLITKASIAGLNFFKTQMLYFENFIKFKNYKAIRKAIDLGHLDVFSFFIDCLSPFFLNLNLDKTKEWLQHACIFNRFTIFEFIMSSLGNEAKKQLLQNGGDALLALAKENGAYEIKDYLLNSLKVAKEESSLQFLSVFAFKPIEVQLILPEQSVVLQ
ncbi:MAG: hypothetical protein LCH30_10200 [Proteobacteria bacterium]|nr:hypothetical protein [Pseudomonadota bacterium]